MRKMMIDYRDGNGNPVRRIIDDFEFCVRDGTAYFSSNGEIMNIPIEDISQIYTY